MNISLVGVDTNGNHHTNGPQVQFSFAHRGQSFVRIRVSWDIDRPPIMHPLPAGGQPKPRLIDPGQYIVAVDINAAELSGLAAKTIDSDLLINGAPVLKVTGVIPAAKTVDRDAALFRLIVS